MNKKLELAEDRFIERIGNMCNKFGLNNFIAQLYAVLYLSNNPLSLNELSQKLRVSKSNVSVNIRELENWGAVRKIWVKGSRQDYYQAELNLKKILSERIKQSMQKHVAEIGGMLDEFRIIIESASGELSDEEKSMAKVYEARLEKVDEIKILISNALKFADRLL